MHDPTSVLPSDDVGPLLKRAVEEAARLLHADGGMVYLVDESGDLRFAHDAGITDRRRRGWVRRLRLPAGSGLFGKAFLERRVQLTGDYPNDERFPHTADADRVVREVGMRSMVVAPLIDGDTALGALGAFASRPDAFGDADVALVRALAEHAAAAIANRRLIDRLGRSEAELERQADAERTLRELAARITSSRARSEILDRVVDEATRLLGGDIATINVLGNRGASVGWGKAVRPDLEPQLRMLDEIGLDPKEGISGLSLSIDGPAWTDDYLADERFVHTADRDDYIRASDVRSVMSAPLRDESGPIGVIQVSSTRPAAFGEREAGLLTALANQASIALTNARLIEELDASRDEVARRADVERSLREIGAQITALRDVDDVVQRTVDEAVRLLHGDGGRIDLVDAATGLLRGLYMSGEAPPSNDVWPDTPDERPDDGISGQAVARHEVVRTGDYLADDRFRHGTGPDHFVRATGIHSVVAAPMPGERGAFGALTVYSTARDAFDDADAATLTALAEQAAVALTNARLISELGQSREELLRRASAEHALREIAEALTAIREPAEVLQRVVEETGRLVRADGTILSILDRDAGELRWSFDDGLRRLFDPAYVESLTLPFGVGPTGIATAEARVVRIDRDLIDQFPPGPENDHFFEITGFRSLVAVPIVAEGEPLGALEVYSRREAGFAPSDEVLLGALASQAAVALTNARLIEELRRSRGENAVRAEREQSLREIAARLTAIREPTEVLQQIVAEGTRLLDAELGRIDLVEPVGDRRQWLHPLTYPVPPDEDDLSGEAGRSTGLSGRAIQAGHPVLTSDYLVDDAVVHTPEADAFVAASGIRSAIAAPLLGEDGLLGVLQIGSPTPHAFGEEELAIIDALAGQASIAITNARLIDALERSRGEIARRADAERSLREIAARVTAIRTPEEVLERVVREARRLLGAKGAVIDLVDPASGAFRRAYDDGVTPEVRDEWVRLRVGQRAVRTVVRERHVALMSDYLTEADGPDEARFVEEAGVRSLAIAPLVAESRALGTLGVFSDAVGRWTTEDASLLAALADQAAIAVTNARLIEELERSRGELARRVDSERALRDIAARITALRDPDDVLAQVVDEARRLLGSDGGHLTLLEDGGRFLDPVVVVGDLDPEDESWMRSRRFPMGTGINGLAAGENRVVWTFDYPLDPRISEESAQGFAARLAIRAMAAAPLRAPGGGVIGTLAVSYSEPREFSDEEVALLQGLADHAAIAVANTRLLQQLRQSEERYRHLVQNSPDLVWAIDADARFTFLSDTAERLTGWKPEELLGRHFGAIVHPASADVARRDWTQGMTEGATELRGRIDLLHKDGHPVPAEFIAQSRVEDGRFVAANGSVRDMTERDRLERELRESEQRFRFLVENSPDVVFATDEIGRFTFMTETIEPMTGFSVAECVGSHFSILVDDGSIAEAASRWEALVAEPSTPQVTPLRLRHKDGHLVPVEVSAIGMRDEHGAFAGIHGATRDVSERARLETGLRRQAAELAASEERAHLARELHDSVTQALFSMTLITRSIELLMAKDPESAREKLSALRDLQRDALAEMRSLIFELRPGSLEQDGLVHALRTHCAAVEGRIGLPIVIDADALERLPLPVEEALYRIAQEALHNIVRHAAARQVHIALHRADDLVRLWIEDDGKGFDADRIPSGHLGVAGMRARAERLRGTFVVRSSPGTGTRIEVAVPADASGEVAVGDEPQLAGVAPS